MTESELALVEPPFEPTHVGDMLRAFGKSVRAHQLYLPNNPMHARAIDARRAFFVHFAGNELACDEHITGKNVLRVRVPFAHCQVLTEVGRLRGLVRSLDQALPTAVVER